MGFFSLAKQSLETIVEVTTGKERASELKARIKALGYNR